MIVNWRPVASISLGICILYALAFCRQAYISQLIEQVKLYPWTFALALPVSLAWILIPVSEHEANGLRIAFLRAGLLLIPAGFAVTGLINEHKQMLLCKVMVIIQAVVLFLLIGIALFRFIQDKQTTHFFYHQLVSPFRQHAVHVSITLFACLLILLEYRRLRVIMFRPAIYLVLLLILITGIIMLSSKLVIIFLFLTLAFYLLPLKWLAIPLLFLLATLIFVSPVRTRFTDFMQADSYVLQNNNFTRATYLNGFEFRYLQWKWIPGILSRDGTWLLGETPGDAQYVLDEHYRSLNLYQGDGKLDTGFIGYNTHNTYLEALLQTGIAGLMATLVVMALLIRSMIRIPSRAYRIMVILICCYSLAESVWDTQSGITLFCFLPLLLGSVFNHGNQTVSVHSLL